MRHTLAAVVLALVLLVALGSVYQLYPDGHVVALQLPRGRELDLNYWPVVGGMRVALWWQDVPAGVNTRLTVFTAPLWPLGAVLLTVAGGMVLLGRPRRGSGQHSASEPG